jgi:hypothetical protein
MTDSLPLAEFPSISSPTAIIKTQATLKSADAQA